LLRQRRERPYHGRAAKKRDELAPLQLINLHPIPVLPKDTRFPQVRSPTHPRRRPPAELWGVSTSTTPPIENRLAFPYVTRETTLARAIG
jgi:hypothetical protein